MNCICLSNEHGQSSAYLLQQRSTALLSANTGLWYGVEPPPGQHGLGGASWAVTTGLSELPQLAKLGQHVHPMPASQVGGPQPEFARQGRELQRYSVNGERLVAG